MLDMDIYIAFLLLNMKNLKVIVGQKSNMSFFKAIASWNFKHNGNGEKNC